MVRLIQFRLTKRHKELSLYMARAHSIGSRWLSNSSVANRMAEEMSKLSNTVEESNLNLSKLLERLAQTESKKSRLEDMLVAQTYRQSEEICRRGLYRHHAK